MIRKTRLAAAFALVAGLTAADAALAQTQTGNPAAAPASSPPAQSAPPSSASPSSALPAGTLPSAQPPPPATKPWDPNSDQRVYSVDPPPGGSSGIYLPAAVLGYAKSAAGCVVIGCDDGPSVGGAPGPASSAPSSSAPASSAPAVPPPSNPGSPDPH